MGCTVGQAQEVLEGEVVPPTASKPKLRGFWSLDEDNKLTNYIMRNGLTGCWSYVAKQAGLKRCGKSCRLRWLNYLRPGLKGRAISRQEKLLIVQLQSSLGNRWTQIAAQLPGRTDNEIKNYWNSYNKKKLKLKPNDSSSSTASNGNANTKSIIPSQSYSICNTNSVPAHGHDVVASSLSSQPHLEVIPEEGYQPHNSTYNILLTTGENQICVPGVSELKREQAHDHNDEFLIDQKPVNNQLISYSQLWINANSTHTHESFSTHTAFMFPSLQEQGMQKYKAAKSSTCDELVIKSCRTTVPPHEVPGFANNYCLGSTGITIPALLERQSLKGELETDGQINENEITVDYPSFTEASRISAWSAGHSGSNIEADFTDVYSGDSYINELSRNPLLEDLVSLHHEKTTHQSCPPLNSVAQVSGPSIRWAADQSNNLDAEDDWQGRLNLIYDANLGVRTNIDINNNWQKSYQIEVEGVRGVGDQLGCSGKSNEEESAKTIPAIFGGGGLSGPLQTHECKGGAGQVNVWAHDDMCNINTAAASDFFNQIYFS